MDSFMYLCFKGLLAKLLRISKIQTKRSFTVLLTFTWSIRRMLVLFHRHTEGMVESHTSLQRCTGYVGYHLCRHEQDIPDYRQGIGGRRHNNRNSLLHSLNIPCIPLSIRGSRQFSRQSLASLFCLFYRLHKACPVG